MKFLKNYLAATPYFWAERGQLYSIWLYLLITLNGMNRLDKFLSYLYPISVEATESQINPLLEVIYQNGKYILNSVNTNYSYGGLYELFELAFQKVSIDWGNVNDVLILGFGAGCVVPLIQQYQPSCKVVGVEIDEKVVELGRKYFGVDELKNTEIIIADAFDYLANSQQNFDLIIVDIYVDRDVPSSIESPEFIVNLHNHLNSNGMVLFNKLAYSKKIKDQIPALTENYKKIFSNNELLYILETGRILISKKI